MIRRDSGMELVEADFGTRRREDRRQNRGSSLIELPSDSHPDEFDSRRATLCMFDLGIDLTKFPRYYLVDRRKASLYLLLSGRKGQLFIIGISSNIEMNIIIGRC